MKKPPLTLSFFALWCLCAAITASASDKTKPGWSFAVEGMPLLEGDIVVKTGFGTHMNYGLASPEATIQISRRGDTAPVGITIKYTESGMICMNYGDAVVNMENSTATVSGKVGCRAQDAHPRERNDKPIEARFELKD